MTSLEQHLADPDDLAEARRAAALVTERGFGRDRPLVDEVDALTS